MGATPAISRALLEKYATSAPRYTSYPTAVDWTKGFDPARYPALLEKAARDSGPLSVYVHLPFCRELCLFCGCNVVISRNTNRYDAYLDSLEAEFAIVRSSGIGARRVRQYHWGGGTPTQLDLARLERVQAAFEKTFQLEADAEVAIEVDPRVTTRDQVAFLAAHGFNRISMGVQDFEPAVQKAIKRVQSEDQTREVVDAAREHGIPSVNIDLIYGLPLQTPKSFEATVERVLDIRPERVALFHYAHVPWLKKQQGSFVKHLPEGMEKFRIFQTGLARFLAAGYLYIGLDHFARPSDELATAQKNRTLHRNFQGYTTKAGADLYGMGVSAISGIGAAYAQNYRDLPSYQDAVTQRGIATMRGYRLSQDDVIRRAVINRLLCHTVIPKREVENEFAISFDEYFAEETARLEEFIADGLVRVSPDEIRVTVLGQIFIRNVAMIFDAYLKEQTQESRPLFSKTL
ncbi:MAG: oxygen-independent coproporphyrinogen III oxidase [Acidobacteria bacterium]|nr:oxygen-independent coproporphyrinogen III oxidase [Acidobacteriota bacterium]